MVLQHKYFSVITWFQTKTRFDGLFGQFKIKMRCLNLGCGNKIKKSTENEEWINLDFRKLEGVDIVCDLTKEKILLEDNSIDFILADDILEHFQPKELINVLLECHRVLDEGGEIEIKTPDIERIIEVYPKVIDDFELDRKIFGGREYEGNQHKIGFTKKSIEFYLNITGFKVHRIENMNLGDYTNMKISATKPFKEKWTDFQVENAKDVKRSKPLETTERLQLTVKLIKELNPKSMINFGIQDAVLERELRKEGFKGELTGFDLEGIIKSYDYSDIKNFTLIKGNCEDKLNIKDNSYSCICCFEILEHLINLYKFLKEIKRILKENGTFFLSIPFSEEACKQHKDHFQALNLRKMEILLNLTGFVIEQAFDIREQETLYIVAKPIP